MVDVEIQRRIDACPKHEPASSSGTRDFSGCVNGKSCVEEAHGGITLTDHCRCGAARLVNIDGWHAETGDWS